MKESIFSSPSKQGTLSAESHCKMFLHDHNSFIQQIFIELPYVPGIEDIWVIQTDKNLCPHGAYMFIKVQGREAGHQRKHSHIPQI